MIELNELKESVRRHMVTNDLRVLDIIAVGHNLLRAYETQNWERVHKKMYDFKCSYNALITEMNKKETPVEDKIIALEEEIEKLKAGKEVYKLPEVDISKVKKLNEGVEPK